MGSDELLAFGSAPRDPAHHASLLPERHLEMPILHQSRTVDHFHAARPEHRIWIAGAEWRQSRQLRRHLRSDRSKRQRSVDPEPWAQIVGLQSLVRMIVDAGAQLADP